MRLRRNVCCGFVPILCSLFAAVTPALAAPKKATVAGELQRLADTGQITPETAAADRAAYDDARTRQKRLTGARASELGGVIRDLDDMAARRQFAPTRLNALFLTLRRNVEWWTAQPLLRSGQRVGFVDSELVYQFYPGHGIQIQWLGTFGKLNGYWTGGKRYDANASRLIDEAE